MANTKISLKLLVHKNTKKVLFAEAGKDFVDFLFSLLALPIGTVINVLTQEHMAGCLGRLYKSLASLSPTYVLSQANRNLLLIPPLPSSFCPQTSLLQLLGSDSTTKTYYCCGRRKNYDSCYNYSDTSGTPCPTCNTQMTSQMNFIANPSSPVVDEVKSGYVKEVVTYMVTDDLVVSPMSTISSITILNMFKVNDVGELDGRIVSVGMKEVIIGLLTIN